MKKIILYSLVLTFSILTVACKKDVKKNETAQFSIEPKTVTVKWTGYKTTSKIPVNGEFKELQVSNIKEASTAVEAMNGIVFSIPVSSIFSGDEERDGKLKQLLFGVMNTTVSLTGTLNLNDDGTGNVNLSMNGVSKEVPITYVVSGQLVELKGTLDLINDFKAESALESLSKACFELHKGPDGVSKTWSEVAISAAVYLKEK
jgi:polyisoprenoid-binding protein YceI